MVSLDTNILVRLVVGDVPEHVAAASVLLKRERCYVTDVVVTEAVFTLERIYGLQRPATTAGLLYIFKSFHVSYNGALIDDVFELYRKRSSLSFVDCYAALEAQTRGRRLATFDKKLAKVSSNVIEPR